MSKIDTYDDDARTYLKRTNPRIPAVMATDDAASTATTITHVATIQPRPSIVSRLSRLTFAYLLTGYYPRESINVRRSEMPE